MWVLGRLYEDLAIINIVICPYQANEQFTSLERVVLFFCGTSHRFIFFQPFFAMTTSSIPRIY